jgi:hypothetical protein
VKRIGLVINPTLEKFDKFSASVEIQDHSEKAQEGVLPAAVFCLTRKQPILAWTSWAAQKGLGLSGSPKLVIDDGSLGFWVALQEKYGPIIRSSSNVCWRIDA